MLRLQSLDGQQIDADSAVGMFEQLRAGEYLPPEDLGRYLDLLRSRACLAFGVDLDVGSAAMPLRQRCWRALISLVDSGWLRILDDRLTGAGPLAAQRRSRSSSRAALQPGPPVTPRPPCVPAEHR